MIGRKFVLSVVTAFAMMLITRDVSATTTYLFTTIDIPSAILTDVNGINDSGVIVGDYLDGSGLHGFIYSGGTFTTIDVPGKVLQQ